MKNPKPIKVGKPVRNLLMNQTGSRMLSPTTCIYFREVYEFPALTQEERRLAIQKVDKSLDDLAKIQKRNQKITDFSFIVIMVTSMALLFLAAASVVASFVSSKKQIDIGIDLKNKIVCPLIFDDKGAVVKDSCYKLVEFK